MFVARRSRRPSLSTSPCTVAIQKPGAFASPAAAATSVNVLSPLLRYGLNGVGTRRKKFRGPREVVAVAHEDIDEAVGVVVAEGDDARAEVVVDARRGGDVRERAVAVVEEQLVPRWIPRRRRRERADAGHEDVQITVVVHVARRGGTTLAAAAPSVNVPSQLFQKRRVGVSTIFVMPPSPPTRTSAQPSLSRSAVVTPKPPPPSSTPASFATSSNVPEPSLAKSASAKPGPLLT
mmetsp:Transcript_29353/g.89803  ORF Transcript_29353/g.89803 Transcript_29353/m.89803 type:complete len:235 (+) Transcript_29353:225-929(+)